MAKHEAVGSNPDGEEKIDYTLESSISDGICKYSSDIIYSLIECSCTRPFVL